jgi:hypothetical protein
MDYSRQYILPFFNALDCLSITLPHIVGHRSETSIIMPNSQSSDAHSFVKTTGLSDLRPRGVKDQDLIPRMQELLAMMVTHTLTNMTFSLTI